MTNPEEVAILTVHGNGGAYTGEFAERYNWPRLQIEMRRRFTPEGHTVIAYGNDIIEPHADYLRSRPEVELHTTDPPMLPVLEHIWPARNWLDTYTSALDDDTPLVTVHRLENGGTHSDRSFMLFTSEAWAAYRFDFSMVGVTAVVRMGLSSVHHTPSTDRL